MSGCLRRRLLRQHLPKSTDFSINSQSELDAIANSMKRGLVMLVCVRWYAAYPLSLRSLKR
jgi:hypothetical protein